MARLKLGVLISGRGSNMEALINAAKTPGYPAEIVVVISNNPAAGGLAVAAQAGISVVAIPHGYYDGQAGFEDAVHGAFDEAGVELVCLAGFMRLLSSEFVHRWQDRLINIHPSLLPAFKGLDVHQRVIEAGARITGCTVHYVRREMDDGPIIIQAAVAVSIGDDAKTLAARVLAAEHRIYPQAVAMIARGTVRVSANRTIIDPTGEPGGSDDILISPTL